MFSLVKSSKTPLFIFSVSMLLSSCASSGGQNENSGMIIGGILGGIVGHEIGGGHGRTIATVLGTMVGMSIGGNIGRSMDDTDRLKVAHSLETVRTGVTTSWQNPDTGNQYKVVPTNTFEREDSPCREYQLEGTIGGKQELIFGTACRQKDGIWKAIN
ncbi:MAG: surface antigen [Alphaproteobacteria bacterium]|jgi:surface antigen